MRGKSRPLWRNTLGEGWGGADVGFRGPEIGFRATGERFNTFKIAPRATGECLRRGVVAARGRKVGLRSTRVHWRILLFILGRGGGTVARGAGFTSSVVTKKIIFKERKKIKYFFFSQLLMDERVSLEHISDSSCCNIMGNIIVTSFDYPS